LFADYVEKDFLGKANTYSELIKTIAAIASSTGLMQLMKMIPDIGIIFYGLGAFVIMVACFMAY